MRIFIQSHGCSVKLQEETHSNTCPKACNEMPLLSLGQHQVGCKQILTSPHCINLTLCMLVLCLPDDLLLLTKTISLAKITITLLCSLVFTEKQSLLFEMFRCSPQLKLKAYPVLEILRCGAGRITGWPSCSSSSSRWDQLTNSICFSAQKSITLSIPQFCGQPTPGLTCPHSWKGF